MQFAFHYCPKYVFSPERGVGTAGRKDREGSPALWSRRWGKPKYIPCSTNLEQSQVRFWKTSGVMVVEEVEAALLCLD